MFAPLADEQRCKTYIVGIHSASLPTSRSVGKKPIKIQAASTAGQGLQSHTEKVSPTHSAPKSHMDSPQVPRSYSPLKEKDFSLLFRT